LHAHLLRALRRAARRQRPERGGPPLQPRGAGVLSAPLGHGGRVRRQGGGLRGRLVSAGAARVAEPPRRGPARRARARVTAAARPGAALALAQAVISGETRAAARACRLVDEGWPGDAELLAALYSAAARSFRV